jgi:Carboxypeptidase regulatory-like domain
VRIALGVLFLAIATQSLCAQDAGKDDSYVDQNQVEPAALKMSHIAGIAKDSQGVAVPSVQILLFTEKDHKLVATTATDKEGEFFLEDVPAGRYRLVAKSLFCPANIPILVRRSGKKELVLHLVPGGTDSCSYGTLKN